MEEEEEEEDYKWSLLGGGVWMLELLKVEYEHDRKKTDKWAHQSSYYYYHNGHHGYYSLTLQSSLIIW